MNTIKTTFNTIKSVSPLSYYMGLVYALLTVVCLAGLSVDDRTLMGVNVWIKPLKFAISTGIYVLTLGFLMSIYPYSKRKNNIITHTVGWTLLIEIGIITYQASRGVHSHYNMSSVVDGLLFSAMGILIGINVLIMGLFLIDTMRLKLKTTKSIQWAILIGWVVVIAGCWVGGKMIGQMSHNVGIADGGAGLPVINWSTVAGDLRIAHFFGLHGIQIIPLFAYVISNKWKTTSRRQIAAVTVFGLSYAAWVGFTFYQAKEGMALINLHSVVNVI